MPRLQPPKGWITLREAADIIGITPGMVSTHVASGHLQSQKPRRGYCFLKLSEVEAFRVTGGAVLDHQEKEGWSSNPSSTFSFVTTEKDLLDIRESQFHTYKSRYPDDFPITLETLERWKNKNPYVFSSIRDEYGILRASTIMLPLSKESIDKIIYGELAVSEIPDDLIYRYTPGLVCSIYVLSVAVDASCTEVDKRRYGMKMLQNIMDFLPLLAQEGVQIETLVARSFLSDGKNLLRKIGFKRKFSPDPSMELYVFDLRTETSRILEGYQEALKQWKDEQAACNV